MTTCALAGLYEWLLDLQLPLPEGSDDKQWLGQFARRMRQVMDERYDRLDHTAPADQTQFLSRLDVEVEALTTVVNLQLAVILLWGTDRQAFDAQLAALRHSIR